MKRILTPAKDWDLEQDKLVRRYWKTKPTQELAAQLGRSEKSVKARAQRLGLRKRLHESHPVIHLKPKAQETEPQKLIRLPTLIKRRPQPEFVPKQCQYILGNPTKADYRLYGTQKFMCGDPVTPGKSYCQAHTSCCFDIVRTENTAAIAEINQAFNTPTGANSIIRKRKRAA